MNPLLTAECPSWCTLQNHQADLDGSVFHQRWVQITDSLAIDVGWTSSTSHDQPIEVFISTGPNNDGISTDDALALAAALTAAVDLVRAESGR